MHEVKAVTLLIDDVFKVIILTYSYHTGHNSKMEERYVSTNFQRKYIHINRVTSYFCWYYEMGKARVKQTIGWLIHSK